MNSGWSAFQTCSDGWIDFARRVTVAVALLLMAMCVPVECRQQLTRAAFAQGNLQATQANEPAAAPARPPLQQIAAKRSARTNGRGDDNSFAAFERRALGTQTAPRRTPAVAGSKSR